MLDVEDIVSWFACCSFTSKEFSESSPSRQSEETSFPILTIELIGKNLLV
jgi:hypothetical protein